ncbi:peptide methionine sulfoxide reductase [Cloeon dipterum]|uniref:peptide methionine sulfoxide reductase n=1 Tax=Cloeon dipterum TaxID=197152 RepID=UPI00322014B8
MASSFLHKVDIPFKKATFALGCFWAPDSIYGVVKGVLRTRVGYTGGTKAAPTYRDLGDHTEAIDIDFDPNTVTYEKLLKIFWASHNPTSASSKQYSSFIYYHDDEQKDLATKTLKAEEAKSKKTVLTKIMPATEFFVAEDYHQKYRLQQHREMSKLLGLSSTEELVNSHIAARLNGYIVGRAGVKQFDEESAALGIDENLAKEIRRLIQKNEGNGPSC